MSLPQEKLYTTADIYDLPEFFLTAANEKIERDSR